MAKPNYAFAKRQKEIAKSQKKEEKLRQKAAAHQPLASENENPLQPLAEEKPAD